MQSEEFRECLPRESCPRPFSHDHSLSRPLKPSSCLSDDKIRMYVEGHLSDHEADIVETHLQSCDACTARIGKAWSSIPFPYAKPCASDELTDRDDIAATSDEPTSVDNRSYTNQRFCAYELWQSLPGHEVNCLAEKVNTKNVHLGRYRIMQWIGSGGFGDVFLAKDETLHRHVAIKIPKHGLDIGQVRRNLLLSEAKTVASLDHQSIVPIYDVGSTEDFPLYIVTKYIEGGSLFAIKSSLSLNKIARLVLDVASALHCGHMNGVIHRDVKPQNILIDESGKAYLTDFGLALNTSDESSRPENAGTPRYMSPEQNRGMLSQVDARSDVFSLGIVLGELLDAWESSTENQGVVADKFQTQLYSELKSIRDRATEYVPAKRFQTAQEIEETLELLVAFPDPPSQSRTALTWAVAFMSMAVLLIVPFLFWTKSRITHRLELEARLRALSLASPANLEDRAKRMLAVASESASKLREIAVNGKGGNRLHAQLILFLENGEFAAEVVQGIINSDPELAVSIVATLCSNTDRLNELNSNEVWRSLFEKDWTPNQRLNAFAFLASRDQSALQWENTETQILLAKSLLHDEPTHLPLRAKGLANKRTSVADGIEKLCIASAHIHSVEQRIKALNLWLLFVRGDSVRSANLICVSPPSMYERILEGLDLDGHIEEQFVHRIKLKADETNLKATKAKFEHLAALIYLKKGNPEKYWKLWEHSADPTNIAAQLYSVADGPVNKMVIFERLCAIDGLTPLHDVPAELDSRLFWPQLSQRRYLLLAMCFSRLEEEFRKSNLESLITQLKVLYQHEADSGMRSMASMALDHFGEPLPDLATQDSPKQSWSHNSIGDMMIHMNTTDQLGHSFALSATEVQVGQFRQFLVETMYNWSPEFASFGEPNEDRVARGGLNSADCMAFCNWLSRKEGLIECYAVAGAGHQNKMQLRADWTKINGYRMPTETEWEIACRAGTTSQTSFGDADYLVYNFAWFHPRAARAAKHVAKTWPNQLGFFDMHGNVCESAHRELPNDTWLTIVHCGGSVEARNMEEYGSSARVEYPLDCRRPTLGMRIAKTLTKNAVATGQGMTDNTNRE